jgi:DNA/RNA-binding domain of Phe-tRNA-synthetase-like protein
MIMRDAEGVSCSILYGQDNRSPITPATRRALYVSYAPPGVTPAEVRGHLDAIVSYVRLGAAACSVEQLSIIAPR